MIQTDLNFFSAIQEANLYGTCDGRKSGKRLKRSAILLAIILALLGSCSDSEPPAAVSAGADKNLRLIIEWPGDDLASKQDLALRDKIEQRLVEKKVGRIVQSGTGMGWMDIVLEAKEPDRARTEIEAIVKSIAPDIKFAIQAE
jgi:hypothetical protein